MKVSIVTAILNSHEAARRQVLHYNKLNLPEDVEVIWVDDGSEPELNFDNMEKNFRFLLFHTHDKRPWTQPAARNRGAKEAIGEFLILTDIDHIIPIELINFARDCAYDVVRFNREVAALDEDGNFIQTMAEMKRYGYIKNGFKIAPHGNSYIFNRELYISLGGVDTTYVGTGKYPNREEIPLKRKLKLLEEKGHVKILQDSSKPMIYMFPNGHYCGDKDANPFGLFHNLTRSIRESRKRQKQYAGSVNHNSGKE